MDTSQMTQVRESPARAMAKLPAARYFHSGAAALLLVLMFLGFQQFFLHGRAYPSRDLSPPIRTLLILHGVAMAAWMVLLVVQPLLIVGGNRRLHMRLGKVGAVLAAAIVLLGLKVGIEATRIAPPEAMIWGLTFRQFMAVPIISILIFALFVAAGLWTRRRPEVHRSMILLATLAVCPAAISRIDALNALYLGTVSERLFGPFFMTLVVGGLFLVIKALLSRSIERSYSVGYAALVAASALIMQVAPTGAWDRIAGFLLG